ncbi:hypothetical protein UK23_28020 [Lentzea aerocolonigenes]|uniref:Uncharacterized protein n=1 Tax=Lentzea aerocolonigenes TaxID=68170 RepID=A0A0F0GTZ3_LENAE|nr:DUF6886 family protein [Lentzea aerocolonigenes]KJK44888.1 hypothetical protein UK23_28020 [Lentzea aerocolonigenes]
MRPEPGQVLHFSEDPSITRFVPHLAATAQQPGEYVWAVGFDRCPDYWFPRQCPRAMAWTTESSAAEDQKRIIGPGCGERVHAIEYSWLERMRTVELYAYRLPEDVFRPFGEEGDGRGHAVVATEPVLPLGPAERVGDLFELHEQAGIGLRVLPNLWPFWDAVRSSSLGWSGIRLRNALARPVE